MLGDKFIHSVDEAEMKTNFVVVTNLIQGTITDTQSLGIVGAVITLSGR